MHWIHERFRHNHNLVWPRILSKPGPTFMYDAIAGKLRVVHHGVSSKTSSIQR